MTPDLLALIARDMNIAPEFRAALPVVREVCVVCNGAGYTKHNDGGYNNPYHCAICAGRGYIVTERQS